MNDTVINGLIGMGAIACVVWLIQGLKALSARAALSQPAAASASAPSSATAPSFNGDIAVIAAAVYAMSSCYRVVHIDDAGMSHRWAAEGRWMHQTSHRLR
jgi:hypothetical protein